MKFKNYFSTAMGILQKIFSGRVCETEGDIDPLPGWEGIKGRVGKLVRTTPEVPSWRDGELQIKTPGNFWSSII
jgi:hypothetical protein